MALINHAKREINVKIVYAGMPGAGKETSLNLIYRTLNPANRGALKTMNVQNDRMLFFDFSLPGNEGIAGYSTRFHVYSLVGNIQRPSTWRMVLKGVDGLVFVADCRPEMAESNRESFVALQEHLLGYNMSIGAVPCVVQCNKRDLGSDQLPDAVLSALGKEGLPVVSSVAVRGEGVSESLVRIIRLVIHNLHGQGVNVCETSVDTQREDAVSSDSGYESASSVSARTEQVPWTDMSPDTAARQTSPLTGDVRGSAETHVPGSGGEATVVSGEGIKIAVGTPDLDSDNRLLLPLSIRYCDRERNVNLVLTVSLESD